MTDRSDFNDLARVAGAGAVASQIAEAIATHHADGPKPTKRKGASRGPASSLYVPGDTEEYLGSRLILQRASDIAPQPIQWLWPQKIALGKLTLIAGDPGLGKSMLTASLAAHVSTGRGWPAGGGACPTGDTLFVSAEDDPADTIRPRLDAAGADPLRVYIVAGVKSIDTKGNPERRLLSLKSDLAAIVEAVRSLSSCRLIVIDPVSAYMDGADSHNNAEVRGLLAPLSELARDIGAAIVAVTHLNKGAGGSALYRATGSLAFVAAARAAFLVTRDKGDPDRRLFLPLKNNLASDANGMAYAIRETEGVPFVAWEDAAVSISADEALGRPEEADHETTLADAAEEWLGEVLACGPVKSDDVKRHAKDAGYSWATIRRAQAAIGIKPKRTGGTASGGEWVWSLPAGKEPDQMPLMPNE
ncbi:AAA family ATPase [Accumulibacter sp.]|uniref:AAA family ATPase n=1 Tax=Accumulibacter sp. TaxID=2053492 RepID=UPI00258DCD9F|nr:AAA family ATPase [Accumulibacter sp.]